MLYQLSQLNLREIAEVLAWEEDSVEKIINRYVRRDAMLQDRIARLDRTGTEQKVENHLENRQADFS